MKSLKGSYLKASGAESERHVAKYIIPYIGQYTHTLGKSHDDLLPGSKLMLLSVYKSDGKYVVTASAQNSNIEYTIPISKILKPYITENYGLTYEQQFFTKLKSFGLVNGTSAGCTGANDFILQVGDISYIGEVKKNLTASFAQMALVWDNNEGWVIAGGLDNHESLANDISKIDHEGYGLFDYMNKHRNPEKLICGGAKDVDIYIQSNLEPVKSYLDDHGIDILHIGTHGSYRVPVDFEGHGVWRVRQKFANPLRRMVQFNIKEIKHSHWSLENDELLFKLQHSQEFSI